MNPARPSSSAPTPDREVLERLGRTGLERVLADLLDPKKLVRAANACGLVYPGMRMQTQKRERILADLAAKAIAEEGAGAKLLRALRKEAAKAAKTWSGLEPPERVKRLRSGPSSGRGDGSLGLRLLLAADLPGDTEVTAALDATVAGLAPSSPKEDPRAAEEPGAKETARLRKKATELQKKLRHLEGQVGKHRETEKSLKRDLMKRKGELAEARMLAERLRRELDETRGAASARPAAATPHGDPLLVEIERQVKKLAAEQKRLAHRLDKLADAPAPAAAIPESALAPLAGVLASLEKEFTAFRRERRKDFAEQAKRLEEIQAAAIAARSAAEEGARPGKPPAKRKGEPERVGVFIDVQNVWYGARQLKGKLDFDALLQAAVLDRRLIQATAYVVESKEIDQSGFIARLAQRGIDVKRKTLKVRADGSMKGDWDLELAFDVLDAASKLHVVVLVSGDGDFTSLVRRVQAIGPKVEVLSFPRNTAKSLIEAADRFQPLDRKYMIRGPQPASNAEPAQASAEEPPVPKSASS